jgi:tetratricopeptide (TPR) repeat protein
MKLTAAAIAFFASIAGAFAAPPTPQALYTAGKYQAAIDAGVAQGTAPGFAVAAHAAVADATIRAACLDCIERAEGFARRAIALDPKLPEGHLYLAIALGYEARIRGPVRARIRGLVEQAKANLDEALAADPNNARVLAALGGWNIAVVSKGGATLARWLYGASLGEGMKDFTRAFRAAPQDVALPYQYALSLASYDAVGYRSEIEMSLSRVIGGNPMTAYDSLTQARARELLRVLKADDSEAFQRLVRRYQGYAMADATGSPR